MIKKNASRHLFFSFVNSYLTEIWSVFSHNRHIFADKDTVKILGNQTNNIFITIKNELTEIDYFYDVNSPEVGCFRVVSFVFEESQMYCILRGCIKCIKKKRQWIL